MTPALEQLAELVRQAEAKSRARKIELEVQHVAEQFRAAELRARRASERLRAVRPASLKALEQADADEQLLKDLVRKLALYKSTLGSGADAEQLIAASQVEIERTRQQARVDLEETSREFEEARRELRGATDQYRQLRRELDRLQPDALQRFTLEDRLLWDAEAHFPGGQLQLLAHEVETGVGAFGTLSKLEQYTRLKVWIGRFRSYQASHDRDPEPSEDLQNLSHRVFHQLKWLSKQHEPGYIEAFRQDFSTDWSTYITEAQEQLFQAIELSRRAREAETQTARQRDRDASQQRGPALPSSSRAGGATPEFHGLGADSCSSEARPIASPLLTTVKELVGKLHLPEEGLDQFLQSVKQAVDGLGASHPELLRLVLPYREYINGDDGLSALRQNLERISTEVSAGLARK
jgi:hypothetical protein